MRTGYALGIRRRPWAALGFSVPPRIPTMITDEERSYLYWLAREAWGGRGDVVEIGPWLGGSTWCLACGMEDNPDRDPASRLHVVDSFRWQGFMSERAPLQLAPGDSFRPYFEQNLDAKRHLLEVHEASLPEDRVGDVLFASAQPAAAGEPPRLTGEDLGEEVALAFVDGAKSWRSIVHLLDLLGPRMAPRRSFLVLQDFQDWASYWIPMAAARLIEIHPAALQLVHVLRWNSVAFRVEAPLGSGIDEMESSIDEITVARGLELVDAAAELVAARAGPLAGSTVRLASVSFLAAKDEWDAARRRFREVERIWPWRGGRTSLERARRWLAQRTSQPLSASRRTRGAEALRRAAASGRQLRSRLLR